MGFMDSIMSALGMGGKSDQTDQPQDTSMETPSMDPSMSSEQQPMATENTNNPTEGESMGDSSSDNQGSPEMGATTEEKPM